MKKFYAFAAAVLAAVSMNAQNGAPLYATGAAPFDPAWAPESPASFDWDGTNYVMTLEKATSFKISTAFGDWDTFNASALCGEVTEANLGTAVSIAPSDGNINLPWEMDCTVTVAGDLSTITVVTSTPKPVGFPKLYVRGDVNGWDNIEGWEFETFDGVTYWFDVTGDKTFSAGDAFKFASAAWNTPFNYGLEGEEVFPGDEDLIFNFNTNGNAMMGEDYAEGTIKVVVDADVPTNPATVTFYDEIVEHTQAGIAEVELDENAPVEYFTIQGVKVAGELANGIYIAKQGNKVTKVLVK